MAMPSPRSDLARSLRVYLFMMLYLVAVKLVITVVGPSVAGFRSPSQAAVFGWPAIGILTAVGLLAVWGGHRVGMVGVWPAEVPLRDRASLPIVLGLGLGAVSVGVDLLTGWTKISAEKMGIPSIHIPFPGSLLIYPGGAVIVNVLYYLVPITLVYGLGTLLVRSPRGRTWLFWTVGALAALIEPVTQQSGNGVTAGLAGVFITQDYVFNLAQVATFRRAGFAASVVLRVSMYLVWHILYGLFQ
jgi:hypothetical protein